MKKITFLFLIFALFSLASFAQKVDTISVFSQKMGREIKNIVITPAEYGQNSGKKYPVIYLLNGYSGNHLTYINGVKKNLPEISSQKEIIFVCPDGQNSWYWDSPIDSKFQFETYVSHELTAYIDKTYTTIASSKGRAITGLSMGGHGALWLAINNPDIFGACGSMSGGVDIRPFPNNWSMKERLGKYADNKDIWDSHTVVEQLHKIQPNSLDIIIDCGIDDFFYDVNCKLHEKMLHLNIPHDFISRPGAHTGEYWNNAIDYQILFFEKFFKK